jgi:pimeloyl-ACP methyl ester carboxylesterase
MKNATETTDLFYEKTGSGPHLMLLHGFPASGILWRNICDQLGKSFTVIIPDLPGSGNGELSKETNISGMAEMVYAIIQKEKISKIVIAGHSMGGYVALAFARRYPEKLAGLSLVHSTTDADDEEKKKARRQAITLIQKGAKKAFIAQMVPNLFSAAFSASNPLVIKQQTEQSLELNDESIINFYSAMLARPDSNDLLPEAVFPFQWIGGLDDTIIPYKKILGKCHIAAVNFVTFYNNCGHMSMLETPERLIKDLNEFVTYCHYRA